MNRAMESKLPMTTQHVTHAVCMQAWCFLWPLKGKRMECINKRMNERTNDVVVNVSYRGYCHRRRRHFSSLLPNCNLYVTNIFPVRQRYIYVQIKTI